MLDIKADINGLKLDRSEWKLVSFGDVAIQQKQIVDRENTELKHYIKGEHMGSEDIHLRNWGELKDEYLGPAFIRKFEKGDILYGSRRTYLRKVVVAPFDGITSNTTFVVKANEQLLETSLLPYIMLSEGFSQHSIKNSKGSVNPYVNWKDLAKYEFLLPPKDQQKKVLSMFESIDNMIESSLLVDIEASVLKRSYLKLIFDEMKPIKTLSSIFDVTSGFPFKSKYFNLDGTGFKLMRGVNIKEGEFLWNESIDRYYDHEEGTQERYRIKEGDVLVPMDGSKLGFNYAVATKSEVGCLLVQRIALLRSENEYSRKLLKAYLSSVYFRNFISTNNTTTAIPHISLSQLKTIKLPQIDDNLKNILRKIEVTDALITSTKKHTNSLKLLIKSTMNEVF